MEEMKNQRLLNRMIVVVSSILLLVAGALSVAPLVPPEPPIELDTAAFSVARAFDHIERIAQEPRPIGSPANQRARAYIVTQLEMLGLEPDVQTIDVPDYFGDADKSVEIGNVVVRIPGTAPTTAVALVGHYDTVPSTPGANDDGSAVAIMLEVARSVLSGKRLHNDVILVFIDCEEPAPRYGSSAFITEHPWAGDIGFVINLEAVGSGGQSTLIGMSGSGGWIIDKYLKAVPYPAAFSFLTTTAELIGGSKSDFDIFRDKGIAGVEFAYLRGTPIYHTPADTPERVQPAHSAAARRQHARPHPIYRQSCCSVHPATSRTPYSSTSVVSMWYKYPITWALPIALVTGAVLAAAGWRQRTWLQILASVAITVVMLIGSAVAGVGIWTVLAGQRSTMGVVESYLYLAGLLILTAGISIAVARVTRRKIGGVSDATGVVIVWWALGLLTSMYAPGMSYLFVWPALVGGVILLWRTISHCQPPVATHFVGASRWHRTYPARSSDRYLLPVSSASTRESRFGVTLHHCHPSHAPRVSG